MSYSLSAKCSELKVFERCFFFWISLRLNIDDLILGPLATTRKCSERGNRKEKVFFLKLLNSDTIKSNWISAQLYFKGNFICPFILEWSLMCVERIALQQVPQGQFQPHKECHKLHLTQVGLQSQPIREKLVMSSMMIQRKNQRTKYFIKNQGTKFLKIFAHLG